MTPPITGRCLCGAVRFLATAAPLWQSHCHCESCRRATASAVTSFFGIAQCHWFWTGELPQTFASSAGVWRDFCPRCVTQMAYRADRFADEIHFYAATLDDPAVYQPMNHVHIDAKMPWLHLSDGLPQG